MVVMVDENTWVEERKTSTLPSKKDIRIKYAEQIYDIIEQDKQKDEHYIYIIPKETRAGATTSLTSVAINKGLPIVVVEPMLRIVTETVGRDGIKYSDKPDTKMNYVHSNRKCALIQAMIVETPELNTIPIILLPQRCFKCDNYESCEFTAVMREPKPDVVAISYKKLIHVNAGSVKEESVSEELLNILLKSEVLLFDEIHEMQNLPPATLPILYFNKTTGSSISLYNFDKYYEEIKDLKFKYPFLYNVLERCKKIINSSEVTQGIKKVMDNALSVNYYEKHISVQLINPLIDRVDVCEKDSFRTSLGFFNDIFNIVVNGDYGRLTIDTEFGVENDLVKLYRLLPIVLAQTMSIGFGITENAITINLSTPDTVAMSMIKDFLKKAHELNKTIIFTSATVGDLENIESTQYWLPQDIKKKYLPFGENGSPMKLNSQMLVLPDTFSLSSKGKYSIDNMLDKFVFDIIAIINLHGVHDCKVIAMNKRIAQKLERALTLKGLSVRFGKTEEPDCLEMTWYKADDTVGVASDRRVIITVGFSHKPVNRFDSITINKEESRKRSHEENHSDFYQAISRGKAPSGDVRSVVFALGVPYRDCVNATTWGSNRRIVIHPTVKGQAEDVEVICDQYIPGPKIVVCDNLNQMLLESILHKPPEKRLHRPPLGATPQQQNQAISLIQDGAQYGFEATMLSLSSNTTINNIKGSFATQTQHRISAEQFLQLILTDKKQGNCSKYALSQHRLNKNILKTYPITSDGKAKWIRFGRLSKDDKDRLVNYFIYASIPHTIEKVLIRNKHEAYNVWIFLVPVQVKKAKRFGGYILKLLDMKCELLPEFIAANTRSKHEIKVPLSRDSQILVDGEYLNEFDTMEAVLCVDLNEFDVDAFGLQVVEFRGKYDRDVYRREDLASKKIIDKLYEEQKKKRAKKKILQIRKSLVKSSRTHAQPLHTL